MGAARRSRNQTRTAAFTRLRRFDARSSTGYEKRWGLGEIKRWSGV